MNKQYDPDSIEAHIQRSIRHIAMKLGVKQEKVIETINKMNL
jgi:hypothetical protein